ERQSDRAELRESLDVQAVRVPSPLRPWVGGGMLKPVAAEGAGAVAERGMRPILVERDAPVTRPAAQPRAGTMVRRAQDRDGEACTDNENGSPDDQPAAAA